MRQASSEPYTVKRMVFSVLNCLGMYVPADESKRTKQLTGGTALSPVFSFISNSAVLALSQSKGTQPTVHVWDKMLETLKYIQIGENQPEWIETIEIYFDPHYGVTLVSEKGASFSLHVL